MRRALVTALITFGTFAVPAVATAAVKAAAANPNPPRAALRGFVCQRATNHLDRAIEVVGVMRPISGTEAMAMKFVLLRRSVHGGSYAPVNGKDLGRWLSPTPATLGQRPTDVWKLDKLVVNLPGQSDYKFRVSFRWTGSASTVLGRSVLSSPMCAQ